MSLKNMLKRVGFDEIMECGDGETAVTMALSRLPDIAILDFAMPKMDGITATREIRKKLKIPIIFLTAAYDAETVQKAKEAGVAAYLTKPLREQDLWPAIELAFAHAEVMEDTQGAGGRPEGDYREPQDRRKGKGSSHAESGTVRARGIPQNAETGDGQAQEHAPDRRGNPADRDVIKKWAIAPQTSG